MRYTKIDKKNLRFLLNSPRGHLYMRYRKKKGPFGLVSGLDFQALYDALTSGSVDLIWIEGPEITEPVDIE